MIKIFSIPGNREDDWVLPKIAEANYWLLLIVVIVAHVIFLISRLSNLFSSRLSVGDFLLWLFCIVIGTAFSFLFFIFLIRLIYEGTILLFRMFLAQREIADWLVKVYQSVENIAQTQVQASQYICERLAEISGNSDSKVS